MEDSLVGVRPPDYFFFEKGKLPALTPLTAGFDSDLLSQLEGFSGEYFLSLFGFL